MREGGRESGKDMNLHKSLEEPGVEVLTADSFARDVVPIFVNRPLCSGSEDKLLDCPLSLGTHMCPLDHSLDAAIHCISKYM